jgi:hypothetical protein
MVMSTGVRRQWKKQRREAKTPRRSGFNRV